MVSRFVIRGLVGIILVASQVQGTLIVMVPYQRGIIVCADRMANRSGETLDTTKIVTLNKNGIATAFGRTDMYEPKTMGLVFSPLKLANTYFSNRVISEQSVRTYGNFLKEEFERVLSGVPFASWPTPVGKTADRDVDFQVLILYSTESHKLVLGNVVFHYLKIIVPTIYVELLFNTGEEVFTSSKPVSFSDRYVIAEIEEGHDSRFDDLRGDPDVRRFYKVRPSPAAINLVDATRIAKKLMKWSSERETLAGAPYKTISIECDCAAILGSGSVIWPVK